MTGQVTERATAPGEALAGSIYDLGYQHYEGPRLGRGAAFLALFVESLRGCFGIGRPGRSKIVPIGLLVIATLPAVISVGVEALLGGIAGGRIRNPIRYDNYFGSVVQVLVLFVAAQAPELLGRDQRNHVLSLYFSRALERLDYAVAKWGALVTALLIVSLLPQATIFVGKVLTGRDVVAAFADNATELPPILLSSIVAAVVMAGIGLAIAAFTPRRAYATAAVFAAFYVSLGVSSAIASAVHGDPARYVVLLAPTDVLQALTAWLFGEPAPGRYLARANLPGELFALAAGVMAIVATAVLVRRYRRIAA